MTAGGRAVSLPHTFSMTTASRPLASSTLTAEEIARFDERGYHLHGKIFSDEEVAAINAAADRVIAGQYDKG